MAAFLIRRILQMIPVILGVTLIIFFVLRVSGDPVVLFLPEDAPQEQVDQLRRSLGLDRPLWEQYAIFMGDLLQGDFGESLRYRNQDVLNVVLERLPATFELAAAAILVAILISLPGGVLAAVYRNRWPDHLSSVIAVLGRAMPNFWVGIMLILLFSVRYRWLPVSGRGGVENLVLPALALGTSLAAILMRLMRANMLEVLNLDYVRTARAKGVQPRSLMLKHALRNALIPYVTVLGLEIAGLIAGSVVTEQVFAWPGIGLLVIQAINSRDMAIVQAVVILSAIVVMVANLVVDIAYALIDPRIRYA